MLGPWRNCRMIASLSVDRCCRSRMPSPCSPRAWAWSTAANPLPSSRRMAASWRRIVDRAPALAALHQFRRRRLCAARRGPSGRRRKQTFPVVDWVQAGAAAEHAAGAGPGDPHLHRRADAGRRRHGLHAGRRAGRGDRHGHPAARPEARRQRPADRRGHRRGTGRAEGRPSPAPPGCRARRRARPDPARGPAAHPGRRLLDRRRDRGARRGRASRCSSSIPTASC